MSNSEKNKLDIIHHKVTNLIIFVYKCLFLKLKKRKKSSII
jgi:hypothetical protein